MLHIRSSHTSSFLKANWCFRHWFSFECNRKYQIYGQHSYIAFNSMRFMNVLHFYLKKRETTYETWQLRSKHSKISHTIFGNYRQKFSQNWYHQANLWNHAIPILNRLICALLLLLIDHKVNLQHRRLNFCLAHHTSMVKLCKIYANYSKANNQLKVTWNIMKSSLFFHHYPY